MLGAIETAPFTAQSIGPIVTVCLQILVLLVLKPVTNSNRFMGFAWCSPCLQVVRDEQPSSFGV